MLLVFSTLNPTGYSLVHWLIATGISHLTVKLAIGLALIMLYYMLIRMTLATFRRAGVIAAGLVSVLLTVELVVVVAPRSLFQSWEGYRLLGEYVLLSSFALTMAFGASWSNLIERLTGQQQKRYVGGPPTTPAP